MLYKITFVDAGYSPNQSPLVGTYGDGTPVNVITLQVPGDDHTITTYYYYYYYYYYYSIITPNLS